MKLTREWGSFTTSYFMSEDISWINLFGRCTKPPVLSILIFTSESTKQKPRTTTIWDQARCSERLSKNMGGTTSPNKCCLYSAKKEADLKENKKWSDPEHRASHAAANGSPDARAKQSRGHLRQWEKVTKTERQKIGQQRSSRWAAMSPERKALFKSKVSQAREAKIDRNVVVTIALQHPELSYREIASQFDVSGMTIRRICHKAGIHRLPGTRPGSRRLALSCES